MSKLRKRRAVVPEPETNKSLKKRKTPDKESDPLAAEGKSSETNPASLTSDVSSKDSKTPKLKKSTPAKTRKVIKNKSIDMYGADELKTLNVSQLLNLGEGRTCETEENVMTDSGGSSDEGDWEEVKMEENPAVKDPVIPKEGVHITFEVPVLKIKKKKVNQVNQVERKLQLVMHKVHVLCLIAHLKFVNTVLNSDTLMGLSLSLITSKNLYPPKYANLEYLERIVKWFHSVVELKEHVKNPNRSKEISEQLCHQFGIKSAYSKEHFVLMFIVVLRTLGLKTRLVMSFQVVPIRPKNTKSNEKSNQKGKNEVNGIGLSSIEGEVKIEKVENTNYLPKKVDEIKKEEKPSVSKKEELKSEQKKPKSVAKGKAKSGVKKKVVKKGKSLLEESDSDDETISKHFRTTPEKPSSVKITRKRKENDSNCESPVKSSKSDVNETPKLRSKVAANRGKATVVDGKGSASKSGKKTVSKAKLNKSKANVTVVGSESSCSSDSDDDFVPQSQKKKVKNIKTEVDRRVFSSDEEEETRKKGVDVWPEVFLEAEEKWISVDVIKKKIHCINEIYGRATHPVVYVVACNNDSTLKDITKKYVPNWHSDTRKRRVDEAWWCKTMLPYLGPKTAQDREEDEDINRQLMDKPLPTSIAEFKSHPLYALKRHLLKFEGIYPPDAPTLGFIKGEPVYARECVVTLRSRDIWFKEARIVRLGEQPYKIVKSRPKYDRMSGEFRKDLPLELFGFWQTDEYIPPTAVDGKVPRNEYGNVDLFKPCMLPKGTVYLQIPGLNKVAKKLGIDCAAAVTGFDFHSGSSHPVIDGFVVCEEFKDTIVDAWNKEVEETAKRHEEKRTKRIYDNWKRLIRGLLIREKLKIKYSFGDEQKPSKPGTSGKKSTKQSK